MICRLCLKNINDVINIFGEQGIELNMAAVLTKYFWFEPRNDDPISTAICGSCWTSVSNFNEFYLSIEEAHRLLTERFSLKTDVKLKSHKSRLLSGSCDENDVDDWLHAISKIESDSTNTNTADECDVKDNDNENALKNEEDCKVAKTFKSEKLWDDDDQLSMNSETFMEEVIGLVDDGEDALALPTEGPSRTTRSGKNKNTEEQNKDSSNAFPKSQLTKDEKDEATEGIKKRRGRPPKTKADSSTENKSPKQEKSKPKRKSNDGGVDDAKQKSYEERMRQIDEKIAQYVRLTCDICALEQPTFLVLRKHMETVHQCKGYATCCNKKFNKRALLYGHLEKHQNPNCYRCESCNKTFADRQCMRNHFLIKHQPEEAKQYQCEHCSKRFARPYILEQHRLIHEERKHICDVCQRGFPTPNALNTHMKIMHSNYGATMCDICAKVIRGRTAFARHQLEHSGIVLPKVQCDKCGSWHKDKYSLQKHKRRHNDEGTVHKCTICGKVAPNRSALMSHQRYVHKSERVFECGVCKKAFKKAITLKEHMAMHTGEVLYSCPHCPRTFNSNANMHSHRKKMHPKEFEETRKQRRENAANPEMPFLDGSSNSRAVSKLEQSQRTKVEIMQSSDGEGDPKEKMIVIKSDDGSETHNILVTAECFSENDDDDNDDMNENSIVFTIN